MTARALEGPLRAVPEERSAATEYRETFPCFGSECTVIVAVSSGHNGSLAQRQGQAQAATRMAREKLLEWHAQFSRFEPASELSRLNDDPRWTVPISPLMRRILAAGVDAARRTGGLVDPTLIPEIERAGYAVGLVSAPRKAQRNTHDPSQPAGPHPDRRWQAIEIDRRAGTVTRPPGVKFDSGGIAKGVFADELATLLAGFDAFVVDCGGDLRLGGRAARPREVMVASPDDDAFIHSFAMAAVGVATSGIAKRSWVDETGHLAHHLLDPRTGLPAFTGIVQATALAPTATEAEVLSKAALLSGPAHAERVLVHGGLLVLDDGHHIVIAPHS